MVLAPVGSQQLSQQDDKATHWQASETSNSTTWQWCVLRSQCSVLGLCAESKLSQQDDEKADDKVSHCQHTALLVTSYSAWHVRAPSTATSRCSAVYACMLMNVSVGSCCWRTHLLPLLLQVRQGVQVIDPLHACCCCITCQAGNDGAARTLTHRQVACRTEQW